MQFSRWYILLFFTYSICLVARSICRTVWTPTLYSVLYDFFGGLLVFYNSLFHNLVLDPVRILFWSSHILNALSELGATLASHSCALTFKDYRDIGWVHTVCIVNINFRLFSIYNRLFCSFVVVIGALCTKISFCRLRKWRKCTRCSTRIQNLWKISPFLAMQHHFKGRYNIILS